MINESIVMKDCITGCGGWMMLPISRHFVCDKCQTIIKVMQELRDLNDAAQAVTTGFSAGPGVIKALPGENITSRTYKFTDGRWDML